MKLTTALACVLLPIWATGCDSDSEGSTAKTLKVQVVASNDLGMHWIEADYSVFAIFPPYNVVRAQVVRQGAAGLPELLDDSKVELRYSAIPSIAGGVNSTSIGKTNFWKHAGELFGVSLAPGEGLSGLYMPADAPEPGPQRMRYDPRRAEWIADGIPITPLDDLGSADAYPLLRITAYSKRTHKALAHLDVAVPVAAEKGCGGCHATGGVAARDPSSYPVPVVWSTAADLNVQVKENILIGHDLRAGTDLVQSTPVLCADCHYVGALDRAGIGPTGTSCTRASLSRVMHLTHGGAVDEHGNPVFEPIGAMEETCYRCHPGAETRALRGAMHGGRRECVDCHGDLLAVGGAYPLLPGGSLDGKSDGEERRSWVDMPRCQSCHTGDAVRHLVSSDALYHHDGLRLKQAYRMRDESASSFVAPNPRFAENPSQLYRDSFGHGGLACEHCHGSTHAEWPNQKLRTSDNVAAYWLQAHGGVLIECRTCHPGTSLPLNVAGPHGLHNVNDVRFVENHGPFFAADQELCRPCHGRTHEGTVLSRAHADRTFELSSGRVVHIAKGREIGCDLCHATPVGATETHGRRDAGDRLTGP